MTEPKSSEIDAFVSSYRHLQTKRVARTPIFSRAWHVRNALFALVPGVLLLASLEWYDGRGRERDHEEEEEEERGGDPHPGARVETRQVVPRLSLESLDMRLQIVRETRGFISLSLDCHSYFINAWFCWCMYLRMVVALFLSLSLFCSWNNEDRSRRKSLNTKSDTRFAEA